MDLSSFPHYIASMDFQKICDALRSCPEVAQTFTHADVVKYIELISRLKPTPALAYCTISTVDSASVTCDHLDSTFLRFNQEREV